MSINTQVPHLFCGIRGKVIARIGTHDLVNSHYIYLLPSHVLLPIQIVGHFSFSRFIDICIHLNIHYIQVHTNIYKPKKPKRLKIWDGSVEKIFFMESVGGNNTIIVLYILYGYGRTNFCTDQKQNEQKIIWTRFDTASQLDIIELSFSRVCTQATPQHSSQLASSHVP